MSAVSLKLVSVLVSVIEIWATLRVQKRLFAFINTLGAAGLGHLVELQDFTVGDENTKIA